MYTTTLDLNIRPCPYGHSSIVAHFICPPKYSIILVHYFSLRSDEEQCGVLCNRRSISSSDLVKVTKSSIIVLMGNVSLLIIIAITSSSVDKSAAL